MSFQSQEDRIPALLKSELDTRRAAHGRVEPTKAQTCAQIMLFATARETYGLIADELADAWQCSHNHVAPRITELKAAGLLVETGRTRLTRAGSPARVLVAKQFATETDRLFPNDAPLRHLDLG